MQGVYPFDTLRRRMMLTSGTGQFYRSSFHCLQEILKYEGAKSLFKGSTANIIRGTSGALVLAVFDRLKNYHLQQKTFNAVPS